MLRTRTIRAGASTARRRRGTTSTLALQDELSEIMHREIDVKLYPLPKDAWGKLEDDEGITPELLWAPYMVRELAENLAKESAAAEPEPSSNGAAEHAEA